MMFLLTLIFCAPYKRVDFHHRLTHVRLALLLTSPEVGWINVKCDERKFAIKEDQIRAILVDEKEFAESFK